MLSGNREAIAKLPLKELEEIAVATLTGMSVEDFQAEVKTWIATAKHPRWNRLYTELTYQPMQEVLDYLRANGYKTYIVTGGGQDFVRVYAERVYGIPPEQVVGTAGGTKFGYGKRRQAVPDQGAEAAAERQLRRQARGHPSGDRPPPVRRVRQLDGRPADAGIHHGGDGARLAMLVLHDDAKREYAYGPAQGLPDTKVGTFTQALYDEAKKQGWTVISMKNDWNRIFAFEQ